MRIFVLITALFAWIATVASAETRVSFSEKGRVLFSFEVPDFWTVRAGGERSLSAPEDDEARGIPQILSLFPTVDPSMWMAFYAPPGVTSLTEGRDYVRDIGQFLASTPDVTEELDVEIAGRPSHVLRGTGRYRREDIDFTVAIIDLPGPRVAIGAVVIEEGADPASVDVANRIFSSFKAGQ